MTLVLDARVGVFVADVGVILGDSGMITHYHSYIAPGY